MSRRRQKRAVRPITSSSPQESSNIRAPQAAKSAGSALAFQPTTVVYCLLLLVLTSLLYWSIGEHPFVNYDDATYIAANPYIQEGLNWRTFAWAWTEYYASNWHPLTWLVHTMDFSLFGAEAGGHHRVSLLFHSLSVILLFLLLARVTGARERSLFVAALFAVHPLNVESVAWAAELKNVLCTFFFLLGLGAYGWYARKPSVGRYVLLATLFLLALASKPMAITLPFVLLLLDYWPLQRIASWAPTSETFLVAQKPFWHLVLEKLPLFAMSAASAQLTFEAQSFSGTTRMVPTTLVSRLENALHSYGVYIWKAIWPSGLAPFYPFPRGATPVLVLVITGSFLLAVSVLVWRVRHEKPYLVTGWLWYLGTLVPVIGLVQVGGQAWADRYAYIPLIGIFLMFVWGLADIAETFRVGMTPRVALASIVLAVFSIVALRQVRYWKSSAELWTHSLNVTEDNAIAERNLAMELMRAHRWADAASHFVRVTELDPGDGISLVDLGAALSAQGQHQDALNKYETAVQRYKEPPVLSAAYRNLGFEYQKMGSVAKAEASYREALRVNPNETGAIAGLSMLMKQRAEEMSQSLAARPTPDGYYQYGRVLEQTNRIPEAKDAYQKALKLDPKLLEARQALDALSAPVGTR